MRIRRIAVLIDGGFFIKRLPKVVDKQYRDSAEAVAETARVLCKRHVQRLIGEQPTEQHSRWLDHVYRLFYYDASPYEGTSQHPLTNQRIDFGRTSEAEFRRALFSALRRKRKFALRLGKVVKESDWRVLVSFEFTLPGDASGRVRASSGGSPRSPRRSSRRCPRTGSGAS